MIPLLLAACTPETPSPDGPGTDASPPEPTPDALVTLTVDGGEGGGDHVPGSTVHVWATLDPTTTIVTGWHASPALEVPAEWNGTVTVPDEDVTIGPDLLAVDATLTDRVYAVTAGPRTVRVWAAPEPTGVVMFFHGASYSTAQLDEPSPRSVFLHLVHAGYTVVAPPSEAEVAAGTGGWNGAGGSTDLRTVAELWDALAADGTAPDGVLRVAWGMSSGGQFAHAVGAALDLDAVVAWCAPGTAETASTTRAATHWFLAANDGTFPTAVADARAWLPVITGRGVRAALYVHPATPVTPLRFTRVPGVDEARSRALAQALLDRGLAGSDGILTVSGAEAGRAMSDLLASDPAPVRTGVLAEIEILGADHELYDDAAARMVAFLATVGG